MILWICTIMNYQINDEYDCGFPGDQFQDLMCISTVELFGYVAGGFLYESFATRRARKLFLVSYGLCLFGACGVLLNNPEEQPILDMTMDYIVKFAIAMAFQGVYLSNDLFPIVFASTTFGVSAMMGSASAALSVFVIYDFETQWPWLLFIALTFVGIVCCLLLKEQ